MSKPTKLRVIVTDQDGVLLNGMELDLDEVERIVDQVLRERGEVSAARAMMQATRDMEMMVWDEFSAAMKRRHEKPAPIVEELDARARSAWVPAARLTLTGKGRDDVLHAEDWKRIESALADKLVSLHEAAEESKGRELYAAAREGRVVRSSTPEMEAETLHRVTLDKVQAICKALDVRTF